VVEATLYRRDAFLARYSIDGDTTGESDGDDGKVTGRTDASDGDDEQEDERDDRVGNKSGVERNELYREMPRTC